MSQMSDTTHTERGDDMKTILTAHETDKDKLATVTAEMETMGAPTIRAYWDGEKYIALEGTHRIAAAAALGLDVEIDECELDDEITHDVYDCPTQLVSDLLEYVGGGEIVEIED